MVNYTNFWTFERKVEVVAILFMFPAIYTVHLLIQNKSVVLNYGNFLFVITTLGYIFFNGIIKSIRFLVDVAEWIVEKGTERKVVVLPVGTSGIIISLAHGAGCGYEKVLNKNNENIKEEGNNEY